MLDNYIKHTENNRENPGEQLKKRIFKFCLGIVISEYFIDGVRSGPAVGHLFHINTYTSRVHVLEIHDIYIKSFCKDII